MGAAGEAEASEAGSIRRGKSGRNRRRKVATSPLVWLSQGQCTQAAAPQSSLLPGAEHCFLRAGTPAKAVNHFILFRPSNNQN
ncbi:hypothetical protein GCM10022409_27310 [Hymenobacter glaciei]|uniref:Uncharacterized protein n=1 Tax=Hymenobacter glaciei TaxID=877209 RepID=A0ABP7UCN3_9BACT